MPVHKKPYVAKPVARRAPVRSRRLIVRRSRRGMAFRLVAVGVGIVLAVFVWAIAARAYAAQANTHRQSFDAIVVLGTPANDDGNPTPELLDRVTEGVREYERGLAPRMIVTGGAAHNRFVEAQVMARVAHAQGVPTPNILEEPLALDTIENVCYSSRILESHGWHSVEVISSDSHLPRVGLILARHTGTPPGLEWRTHAAPRNLTPSYYGTAAMAVEVLKTARYLAWARWVERCSP